MNQRFQFSLGEVLITQIASLSQDSDHAQKGWIINAFGVNDNSEETLMMQPRLLATKPDIPRGNHYHQLETETIIFLNNQWRAVFSDLKRSQTEELIFSCQSSPVRIVIPPKIAHVFVNLDPTDGYIFHYANKPYTINRSIPFKLI